MADDEIENIRNMVMMKNKNPKSRKKRGNQGRGTAAAAAAKPPPPPPPPVDAPKTTTEAANGHHSAPGADTAAASPLPPPPGAPPPPPQAVGDGDGEKAPKAAADGREAAKEVRSDLADSDDEIPLPEGVPGFEALEEAMLVRELTKDRLPGKIVRGSDGSGNTASRFFFFFFFVWEG